MSKDLEKRVNTLVKLCKLSPVKGQFIHQGDVYCKWIYESVEDCEHIDVTREIENIYGTCYGCTKPYEGE